MDIITTKILKDNNIEVIKSPKGIEVVKRSLNDESYYFVMNHTDKEQEFKDMKLTPYEATLIKTQ